MCQQCNKNPVWQFTNKRKLCARCFVKYFEKKFLYTIRKFRMIKNGDLIGYENKGDFRGVVLEHLLKMFSEKDDINLCSLHLHHSTASPTTSMRNLMKDFSINKQKILAKPEQCSRASHHNRKRVGLRVDLGQGKVAITNTLDVTANEIIKTLIKGKASGLKKMKPVNGKIIKPLYLFLDAEVLIYAKIKGLKIKKKVEGKDNIEKFIDELEKKHPEIKNAIVKGYLRLKD